MLIGVIDAIMVGVLDVILGLCGTGMHLAGGALVMLFFVAALTLVPFGAVIGFGVGAIRSRLHLCWSPRAIIRLFRTPLVVVVSIAGVGALASVTVWLGYRLGIQIEAIDYRPALLLGMAIGLPAAGCRWARLSSRASRIAAIVLTSFSLGALAACVPRVGSHAGVLPLLQERTVLLKPVFVALMKGLDNDRDGFSKILCESNCDCDDGDPSRNPGALDIPDNGIDEDCSGDDLRASKRISEPERGELSEVDRSNFTPPYNIVLITIDTLRADRMHTYGYARQTTPNLDRFAEEAVLFEQVRSQGSSTRFVFPVLLTGRYFSEVSQKKGKKWYRLMESNVTFAELLKERGYRTVSVLPYFRFKEHSGFQQGFDIWEPSLNTDRNSTWDPTGDLVTDRGIEHIESLGRSKGPWLLWLHYFDPHASYVKHDDQPSFGNRRADHYDGEILYVDRQVQRFLDELKHRGLYDNVAVIVGSDHGEGIGLDTDHGLSYHGFSLFDSETRVPLMIKLPGASPRRVTECVGVIDVVPTLLELGGVSPPANLHGKTLIPYLLGANPKRGPFLLQLPVERPQEAVVDWPYKLIWEVKRNRFSLYNLEKDPFEQADLTGTEPREVARLKDLLNLLRYKITQ